jgi:hypothetical protein
MRRNIQIISDNHNIKKYVQVHKKQVRSPQVWNKHSNKLIKTGHSCFINTSILLMDELKMRILKSTGSDGETIPIPDKRQHKCVSRGCSAIPDCLARRTHGGDRGSINKIIVGRDITF